MKIVIDLPEWFIEDTKEFNFPTPMDKAIINGQPLDEILDKISSEIEEKISHYDHFENSNTANGLRIAKEIVEKHKKGGDT